MKFPKDLGALSSRDDDKSFQLSSPQDLTAQSFSCVLREYYGDLDLRIAELSTRTLHVAILSEVLEVSIVLDDSHHHPTSTATAFPTTTIPTHFIVKFLRSTVPLKEMFRVEAAFYKNHAKNDVAFFQTPSMIHSNPECIVLEKICNATQSSLLEGCPVSDIAVVLTGLAQMHAHAWRTTTESKQSSFQDLSKAPGMGSSLSGLNKERQFPHKYSKYLERLYATQQPHLLPPFDKMTCLCQDLATRRLREVHKAVHSYKPTLVHGDFHVGNLLKSDTLTDATGAIQQWYLLDWATCGAGNPLMDLVFFLLVSTRATTPAQVFHKWLPFYYQALIEARPSIANELAYDSCIDLFRECLIDEFLILVCYDDVSRDLVSSSTNTIATLAFFEEHFMNVNTRAVNVLLSTDMTGYPFPPRKTKQDMELERQQEPEWRRESDVVTEI